MGKQNKPQAVKPEDMAVDVLQRFSLRAKEIVKAMDNAREAGVTAVHGGTDCEALVRDLAGAT